MNKILKVLGIFVLVIVLAMVGLLIYLKTGFPKVPAASDIKIDITPERIERGQYLANHVTVCMDCHSQRDFSIYTGPLVPGTLGQGGEVFDEDFGFPGTFYSKNITPSGVGSWTDGELLRAITTGVNKDGKSLFPLMPYKRYGKMATEDLYDIIAYIRSLKPIDRPNDLSEPAFPFNFILPTIPGPATPSVKPPKTDLMAYGQYLVNAASCYTCHTKEEKGEVVGEDFAGGFVFRIPGGIVRSANITSDKETGIGLWTEASFLAKFKAYSDSAYTPAKLKPGEKQTVMPWLMYAGMDSVDLKAIYAYISKQKPVKNKVVPWEPAPAAP